MTHASLPPFLKHLVVGAGVVAACACTIWLGARLRAHPAAHPAPDRTLAEYFHEAQQLAADHHAPQQTTTTATFLAVGDISLSRSIAQTIKSKGDILYPFRGVDELLRSTDFNFGNLETPFSSSDRFTASNTLVFNAPKANVAGLAAYNFTVLNLANNHAFDQGLNGITTTRDVLAQNNILFIGAGRNLDEAWAPAVYEVNGIKIGFIGASYASVNDGGKTTNNYVARIEDVDRLKTATSNLKPKVDFVVVTMHAGTEYTTKPNPSQIDFAHAAIDAGADIVIGAHPHWIQEKETYCPKGNTPSPSQGRAGERLLVNGNNDINCKPIYYSLGNFIFDQSWSEQTKKGLALKITLSKSESGSPPFQGGARGGKNNAATITDLQGSKFSPTVSIQEIPIYIKENCCPIVATKP